MENLLEDITHIKSIFKKLIIFSTVTLLLLSGTLFLFEQQHRFKVYDAAVNREALRLGDRIQFAIRLNRERLASLASRTMIRRKLALHHHNKLSLTRLRGYTGDKFRDGCAIYKNLSTARRTTTAGKTAAHYGERQLFKLFNGISNAPALFLQNDECLLYLRNAVMHNGIQVGTDHAVFQLSTTLPTLRNLFHGDIQLLKPAQAETASSAKRTIVTLPGTVYRLSVPVHLLDSGQLEQPGTHSHLHLYLMVLLLAAVPGGFWLIVYRPVQQIVYGYSKTLTRLEETVRQRDRFFSIIAHDLRGPVSGLMRFSAYVENNWEDFSEHSRREGVAELSQTAGRVYLLLENLLEWSQLKLGITDVQREPLDPIEATAAAIALYQPTIREKNIRIELEQNSNCKVLCDRKMLETVTRNLVSNAVKFLEQDGLLTVTAKQSGGCCRIIFCDNGRGMNDEQLQQLFQIDKKHSTPGTRDEAGSGLGLQLVRDLLRLNNGEIAVSSRPAEGTTVVCHFEAAGYDSTGG